MRNSVLQRRTAMKRNPHKTSTFCLLPSAFLFLLVILACIPVWHAGFIWDDDTILTANPCIIGPLGLKEIWTTSAADICPLTITTFWLEHALWGLAPLPYHLVNVLLHGACAILLWRVLRSLTAAGAWLGAALWAVHPVQVESVAWITEMKNTESGLFFLLSILFFVKWLRAKENKNGRTRNEWNYAFSLLFAALAMSPGKGPGSTKATRHSGPTHWPKTQLPG
jgi:protein O-mannosyl-transferase